MEFSIAKAGKKDLRQIAKIFRAEYKKRPYNEKWTEKRAFEKIKEYFANSKIFAARAGKEVVGFVVFSTYLWHDGKRGLIEEICILSGFQGFRIGSNLLLKVENELRKNRIKKLDLRSSNKSLAFKFHKKHGFKENDLVYMTKEIE